jgi:hypothetical protein
MAQFYITILRRFTHTLRGFLSRSYDREKKKEEDEEAKPNLWPFNNQ